MAQANYAALAALPGSYVIRFTADTTGEDLYEYSPAEGTLLNHSPAGMFTDTLIYWIERVRSRGAIVRTDDDGQVYASYAISLHKGDSTQNQRDFLPALSADWSWVLINETTQEWIMWPANDGDQGGGYVEYQITPSFITETATDRQVPAVAERFIGGEGSGAVAAFAAGLPTSEVVVGLIPNHTFRPAFSMPVLSGVLASSTGGVLAAEVRVAIPVPLPLTAVLAAAAGRVLSAALRVQLPVSLTAARARAAGRVTAAALTIQIQQIHRALVAAIARATGGVLAAALLVAIKQSWEGAPRVSPYCTPAQLEQVIGRDHLITAAPDPDVDDAWDEGAVAAALAAVSERVDARIRAAYTVPLADVPAFVTRAVARLAHAELVTEAASTDLIQSRATEAWRLVTDLATGAARLDTTDDDLDGTANPRTRQGRAVRVRGRDRWFPRGRPTGAI